MSIQPLWLTHFSEIRLVLEFQLTKFIVGTFSYKAHFRPQIYSNESNTSGSPGRTIEDHKEIHIEYSSKLQYLNIIMV